VHLQNPEGGDLTEDWDDGGVVSVYDLDGVDLGADEDPNKDLDKEVCDTNDGSGTSSSSWSCPDSSSSRDNEDDDVNTIFCVITTPPNNRHVCVPNRRIQTRGQTILRGIQTY